MTRKFMPFVLLLAVIGTVSGQQLGLGNPSGATHDISNKDNYLLIKAQYALSYNSTKGGPNWVSWTQKKSDLGKAPRKNQFHTEGLLPDGFQQIKPSDYAGSGYDQGHMCDAKDRTKSAKDMYETFSMANMLPQAKDLNEQTWKSFETYSRNLAVAGHTVYIVAGCYGSIGEIGSSNTVNVPARCWKVIEDAKTKEVIAVDMPNENTFCHPVPGRAHRKCDDWTKYTTTVAAVEAKTGFHFEIKP